LGCVAEIRACVVALLGVCRPQIFRSKLKSPLSCDSWARHCNDR
jgi:hypothetical protein